MQMAVPFHRSLKASVTLFTLAIPVLSLLGLSYYASRMLQEPQFDGIEATVAIRADSLNRTTPILAKPVDPGKLYETLLV